MEAITCKVEIEIKEEDEEDFNYSIMNPLQCTFCGKTFSQKNNLSTHMSVHTGERPYSCTMCTKTFTHRSNLNKHIRVHTGDRPYKCEVCDAKFAVKGTLNLHMAVHTGDRPYSCKSCEKSFAYPSGLRKEPKILKESLYQIGAFWQV